MYERFRCKIMRKKLKKADISILIYPNKIWIIENSGYHRPLFLALSTAHV